MKKSSPSAVEYKLMEIMDQIKSRTLLSVSDMEEFGKVVNYTYEKIKELRISRDLWKEKYEVLRDGQ